ncbi:hypothetical protein LCGC14_0722980 [marine sediment metagenome]|uniref:Uncharacterized protein n=1 Tax=marine sediment metagenome TaxID=412755 RepID=A0A0F9QG27_9ZZZZ
MLTLIIIGAASLYVLCGLLAYKATFAFFQKEYPGIAESQQDTDRRRAWCMAVCGPVGLLVAFLCGDLFRHGFTTKS